MKIENNKVVSMVYQAIDNKSGVVLDGNNEHKPLQFLVGKENIVPGLDKGMIGMETGEEKEILVEAKEAYGEKSEEALKEYPIEQFQGIKLENGMTLANVDATGKQIFVKVAGFDDNAVKIDFNHPLSGKDIKFKVQILEVRDATSDELAMGSVNIQGDGCGCGTGCGCH